MFKLNISYSSLLCLIILIIYHRIIKNSSLTWHCMAIYEFIESLNYLKRLLTNITVNIWTSLSYLKWYKRITGKKLLKTFHRIFITTFKEIFRFNERKKAKYEKIGKISLKCYDHHRSAMNRFFATHKHSWNFEYESTILQRNYPWFIHTHSNVDL